ncbi:peptidoglycan-binding lysin subgroup [Fusarium phyllophilum]|uniref:Peptidoglycan-binding lysin subgroup n=1 Tax=Fusarium phyllophilum TaxID=47803 RepID=A0A8H5IZ77_9HYPO|nr:peptidoglycan-binding lysin subgroup [Fusarium phyllophilum]
MVSFRFFLPVLGLMVAASIATPKNPPKLEARQNCDMVTHVVQHGDGLSAIADSASVDICNIATANAITDINSIYVSQTLTFAGAGCEAPTSGVAKSSVSQCCIPAITATNILVTSGYKHWDSHTKRGEDLQKIIDANPSLVATSIPVGAQVTLPARPSMNC